MVEFIKHNACSQCKQDVPIEILKFDRAITEFGIAKERITCELGLCGQCANVYLYSIMKEVIKQE